MFACKKVAAAPLILLCPCVCVSLSVGSSRLPKRSSPTFSSQRLRVGWRPFWRLFSILAVIFCIFAWFTRGNNANQCICLLQELKAEQDKAVQTKRYPAASCPICLEDFAPADGVLASPSASTAAHTKEHSSNPLGSRQGTAPSAPQFDDHPEYESLLADTDRETDGAPESSRVAAGRGKQLKPRPLSCGHTFCDECISAYINSNMVSDWESHTS